MYTKRSLNPRFTWCYAGEDLMKIVRPLVNSGTPGNSWLQATEKAMLKYVHALDSALADPEHWYGHYI